MSVSKERTFSTALTRINDTFMPMIERQLSMHRINMDGYARQCVMSALSAIHFALEAKNTNWNDPQLDKNNLTQILLTVAALKLNAAASPREVYFQVRNVATNRKDEAGNTIWKKQIEMGIEGDGNDAILARFGRNVKKVAPFWLVREGDYFEYPKFNGLEMEPPKWQPTGQGEVVRVVYPIIDNDDMIHYYIGERADVARNLVAHINNNLMNETFGICKDRYKATDEQKRQIAEKKAEILKRAKELGLDALDDPELQQWISPAWTEYQSREAMIIRKMRNNVVRKIPKDFGNAFVEMIHNEATDETYTLVREEIAANANREPIDIEASYVETPTAPEPPEDPDIADPPKEAASTKEPEPFVFGQVPEPEQEPVMAGPGF
ncbi:MAG: hypothetical protein K6T83_06780 [Alicyclobacillus sp.]|nr:hypothetical protein [Alicyclobacillus sp.]